MAIPQQIDRYRVESQLGQGGMGRVYAAVDPKLGRRVAIKVLAPAAGTDDHSTREAAARMVREARAVAALSHPNIVAIYDVGEAEGQPFIAMELVEGRTMRSFVGDASVPLERRLTWLASVARALGAAHRVGLLHRDVKPDNVMIARDGTVKMLDFGIARRIGPSQPGEPLAFATMTTEGALVGTPLYMAPEQLKGEPLDGRCDQFAWGVMAFELLTGKIPWPSGRDHFQIITAILTTDLPPLWTLLPDIAPNVDHAVHRALEREPSARFASMEDLVATLEGFAPLSSGDLLPSSPSAGGGPATTKPGPVKTPLAPHVTELRPGLDPMAETSTSALPPPPAPAAAPSAAAAPAPDAPSPPRWRGAAAGAALVLLTVAATLLLRRPIKHALLGRASASSASASASASAAPAPPSRHLCATQVNKTACGHGTRAWCDGSGARMACCAEGLVPANKDGICVCPPGGTTVAEAQAKGCAPPPGTYEAEAEQAQQQAQPAIEQCFAEEARKTPDVIVKYTATVMPDGSVFSPKIAESSVADASSQACALSVLKRLRLPPPPEGAASLSGSVKLKP